MREVIAGCERTLLMVDQSASCFLKTCCLWDIWTTSALDK
jgi:hypothetical protein